MATFIPRPGAPEPEDEPTLAWLQATLDRLAPERGIPPGTTWRIEPGVREASAGRGTRLRQTGFRISALDAAARTWALTCFVNGDDVLEEEFRASVEQVLALWLDRLSVTAPE